jgi:hypothetical protein
MSHLGQWEERCLALLDDARRRKGILWIEDLHLWGRLGQSRQSERSFADFLAWLHRERVVPQIILYSPDEVRRFADLTRRGMVPWPNVPVLFVLGHYTSAHVSEPRDLDAFLHLMRIDAGDRKPLIAGAAGNAHRRIGGGERHGRQQALPMLRQADQILTVGAIAMHQHHQMGGGTARWRQSGTGKCHVKIYALELRSDREPEVDGATMGKA